MTDAHYSIGLRERDRVDHAIGGGLPRESIVLFEGPDGAGKSVFSQRVAYGLAEEGHAVSVVSTEQTAREYISQMHSLSYDVVDHLLCERILFLHADVDTHDLRTGADGGPAAAAGELGAVPPDTAGAPGGDAGPRAHGRRELVSRLCSPGPLWRADVVVVDGFDALVRNDPTFDAIAARGEEDHAMQRVVSFLRRVTADGTVVVLTVNPESATERTLRPLRDVADVYFELRTKTVGQEIRNQALVRRFSGMKNPVDDTIGFSVQQGRGMVIESRTVA